MVIETSLDSAYTATPLAAPPGRSPPTSVLTWSSVWGFGFEVWGFGFWILGLGFRVEGIGLRVEVYTSMDEPYPPSSSFLRGANWNRCNPGEFSN